MATDIHTSETGTPDSGTYVQASAGNESYVRVQMDVDNEALVRIVLSETNGTGVGTGDDQLTLAAVASSNQHFFLPSGTYYINADIVNNETSVTVTVQN